LAYEHKKSTLQAEVLIIIIIIIKNRTHGTTLIHTYNDKRNKKKI